mgnify:FL=1
MYIGQSNLVSFLLLLLGGIKTTNTDIVWQAHPDFICAVSEITESDNIQNTIYELMMGYSRVR